MQWVKTTQYLGGDPWAQLTWTAHINEVGRKAAQELGAWRPS
jgi:hypothetical protein